jgi:hypothetical protein
LGELKSSNLPEIRQKNSPEADNLIIKHW